MSSSRDPSRGEVWTADLNPTRGREQAGHRPVLVLSNDPLNHGPAGLIVAAPLTSREKHQPLHAPLDPPEGGVKIRSYVKCEDIRSLSKQRLGRRWGRVSAATMAAVEERMRILLDL